MAFNYEFPYTDPNLYNDDWLLRKMKDLLTKMEDLDEWREQHEAQYQELKALYDDIISGNFPDSVKNAFYEWMQANAIDLVASLIKHIYFGLTDDGYFCAFIPENWSDIHFDSVTDFSDPLYGHLLLMYD